VLAGPLEAVGGGSDELVFLEGCPGLLVHCLWSSFVLGRNLLANESCTRADPALERNLLQASRRSPCRGIAASEELLRRRSAAQPTKSISPRAQGARLRAG
jgi:hypothetical protein